jgi:hypothetical protein
MSWRVMMCDDCHGTGDAINEPPDPEGYGPCPSCGGNGLRGGGS